jgi:hypothetical protein
MEAYTMAKINEQTLTIKLSQLLKDDEPAHQVINDVDIEMLVEAIKSMVGKHVLIELENM